MKASPTSLHLINKWKFFFSTYGDILAGGLLILMSLVAMIWANSSWQESYFHLQDIPLGFYWEGHHFSLSFLEWINDGLMAIFFLFAGMEIKKEIVSGELSSLKKMSFPVVAALGGMIVPALIYFSINPSGPASNGWGIPMATDIAFSIGILSLLGKRVPASIKVFLLTLAVVDDLGAILVIALFYSKKIQLSLLLLAAFLLLIKKGLFLLKIRWLPLYLVVGFLIWLSFLGSGIHATIAGVLMGLLVPASASIASNASKTEKDSKSENHENKSKANASFAPLDCTVHALEPWIKFFIMPVFALFNAGVALGQNQNMVQLMQHPLFLGVSLGLFLGKPLGITGACWLAVKCRVAQLPSKTLWSQIFGVSLLAGIGFTMSLFISNLALKGHSKLEVFSKVGVLFGSLLSACVGMGFLYFSLQKKHRSKRNH